ncbi:MAG: hypothetical protein ABSA11_05650 [Candidatus Bathyarchaeia archaeon]
MTERLFRFLVERSIWKRGHVLALKTEWRKIYCSDIESTKHYAEELRTYHGFRILSEVMEASEK